MLTEYRGLGALLAWYLFRKAAPVTYFSEPASVDIARGSA
jgi:hypothetical protein